MSAVQDGSGHDRSEHSTLVPTSSCSSLPILVDSPTVGSLPALKEPQNMDSKSGLRLYCESELRDDWSSMILILCFFVSGLIDAVAFNTWGCFVGMQTGNTVFAALGISHQPEASHEHQAVKSAISIACFVIGTFVFQGLARLRTGLPNPPQSRCRGLLVLSFAAQTVIIAVVGVLVQLNKISTNPFITGSFSSGSSRIDVGPEGGELWIDLLPIGLLAFQAAGQVTFSRQLGLVELPTIVLSTIYHDFSAEIFTWKKAYREVNSLRKFFTETLVRQERMLLSIIALFAGATSGGFMYQGAPGLGGAFWLAAALKGLITAALIIWPGVKTKDRDDVEKAGQDGPTNQQRSSRLQKVKEQRLV